ncbi:MAG: hypothetical protein NC548_05855 [Lachnospiraceae bacterium]|nr:hypothetical protein [Lachnospiraceae bacterium]
MANTYGSFTVPAPLDESTPVYQLTRTAWEQQDESLLATVVDPTDNSIAVITTIIDGKTYDKIAYIYSEESGKWEAMTGEVDASKVVLKDDITCAGNYSQVGNITKSQTGTAVLNAKGKTVAEVLSDIFSKRVQPTATNPTLGAMVLIPAAGPVEAGTILTSVAGKAVVLDSGEYSFGPATGVTATGRTLSRICIPADLSADGLNIAEDGSFNDASRITVGDQGGEGVVSSLSYKETVTYGEGVTAKDNMGDDSVPAVKIPAGEVSAVSDAITCFRKYFVGATAEIPANIDSAFIRSLTGSAEPLVAGSEFDVDVPAGSTLVVIAYPASLPDLKAVKDTNALGLNILGAFDKTTVNVAGANGYTAIAYKVYTYEAEVALAADRFTVSL